MQKIIEESKTKMNAAEILFKHYNDLKARQPYHINLLDELHANENAHTRILVKLLQYQKNGRFFILDSFLELIRQASDSENSKRVARLTDLSEEHSPPRIIFGENYIDALILYSNCAIIIENKIHWAADQYAQIQRYVESVEQKIHDVKNIFVIYLTANGNKKVSDDSLTPEARKALDYTDETDPGRFLQLTYLYHILPWLENEVLPSCTIREEWLISALRQYTDHLKGMFGLRDNDEIVWNRIRNDISGEAIRDFQLLEPDTPAHQFMNNLIMRLKRDLEKTFCDRILNYHLGQSGFYNPGSWYPDFGSNWGTIECPQENPVGYAMGLEKFQFGFPSKSEAFSEEWSRIYWQTVCKIFPEIRRNQFYWLGFCFLPDRDFCSTDILQNVFDECCFDWERSRILNSKAEKIAKYVSRFYNAVKEAHNTASGMTGQK